MTETRPNVLLVVCDALRGDHVGPPADGAGPSLTPTLDALAAEGVRFTAAVSQGFRTPISMPSLFTGKYPGRLQWFRMPSPFALRAEVTGVLLGQEATLPEILARHGYHTAGIHSNPLLTRLFGYDRGFAFFDDDLFMAQTALPRALKRWTYRLPQLVRVASHLSAARTTDKAVRWLREGASPFFLWTHYMDTHGPYRSQAGIRYLRRLRAQLLYQKAVSRPQTVTDHERRRLHGWYRAQVRYADEHVGRLLDFLRRQGRFDDTLIVVTADHGEEFGEHGHYSHHSTLYQTLLHVPLIVKLPHGRHRGTVVDQPVGLVQVVATVLGAVGVPSPPGLDGPSLLPLLEGWASTTPAWILSEAKAWPQYKASIRHGRWKCIVDRRRGRRELFDLETDPGERTDLAQSAADVANRCESELHTMLAALSGRAAPERAWTEDMDAATTERLRDLGYLGILPAPWIAGDGRLFVDLAASLRRINDAIANALT
jgi:arylsulfatase A-like enzyme